MLLATSSELMEPFVRFDNSLQSIALSIDETIGIGA